MLRALGFDSIAMHLIATWCFAVVSRIYDYRILNMLRELNVKSPPLYPGIWLLGCGAQVFVTIIAFAKFKQFARVSIYVLYGYWLCVIVSLTACLLYQGSVLVR